MRRTALAALCCGSAAALAGLPTLDLYLDLRMTVRGPADALETIAAQPDGLILWESAAAPDWGDELEGLDVIAVDPGAKNVAGLPSVRRGRAARLFEPPFDTQEVVGACSPGSVLLVDSTADVWERETLPLIEIAAAAASRHREGAPCRSTTDDARAGQRGGSSARRRGARCRRSARPTRAPAPAASASRCPPTGPLEARPDAQRPQVRRKIDVHTC